MCDAKKKYMGKKLVRYLNMSKGISVGGKNFKKNIVLTAKEGKCQ